MSAAGSASPEGEDEAVAAHLLDALGLGLLGADGEGVLRARRAAPSDGAFVMSLAIGALGLDDFDEATRAHPGTVLVPALVEATVASAEPVSGRAFGAALSAGYALFAGYGRMADAGTLHLRGFHPSALLGPLSAAGAVAVLHGGDRDAATRAARVAASFASGITEFDAKETMRGVQTAWAASTGLRAAALVEAGFDASAAAIDGRAGLLGRTHGEAEGWDAGDPWTEAEVVARVSFKPYPHFSDLHPATSALIRLLADDPTLASRVDAVTVTLRTAKAARLSTEHPPSMPKTAKRSTRFVFASCLVQARRTGDPARLIGAFAAESLRDAEVLALAERVHPRSAAEAVEDVVEVTTVDGEVLTAAAAGYPGDGRDPALRWGLDAVRARLHAATAELPRADAALAAELADAVARLEEQLDLRPLLGRFRSRLLTGATHSAKD
ncbi:MAG TPA: MmgE/PrpD family protein [Gryllotalpicola sp.]